MTSGILTGTEHGPLSLEDHERVHGPAGHRPDLIALVERAGLRGRGGASFPTAVKMKSAAEHRGPRTVLVNAAEGEPLSAKDRVLLQFAPHLVLDGALAAARAIDAKHVVVAVRGDAASALASMQRAIAERGVGRKVRIAPVPVAYLAGQESALINFLEGRPLRPSTVPPLPVERGLRRRATLVQNPETIAQLALIDRGMLPTTGLLTISGAVHQPGVIEVETGETVGRVIRAAGGLSDPLRAVLVGGFHGVWHAGDAGVGIPLDDATRASGVVVALGSRTCGPREITAVVRWLAQQSAGQCGPCANGLPAIADVLEHVVAGTARPGALVQAERWSHDVTGRGACHLPDGAMRFLRSGLEVFAEDFVQHMRHGPCAHCRTVSTLLPAGGGLRRAA